MKMKSKVETFVPAVNAVFNLDDFIPHRLAVAASALTSMFAATCLKEAGVSTPEWRVLATLGRLGAISPTVIGQQANMDKVQTSRASGGLVAGGYLKRTKDTSDGRGRRLSLTKKGVALHNEIAKLSAQFRIDLATVLGKQETDRLGKSLSKIAAYADRSTSGASDPSELEEAA
jgi:DNA-binding MarR family transcriptional regulator